MKKREIVRVSNFFFVIESMPVLFKKEKRKSKLLDF